MSTDQSKDSSTFSTQNNIVNLSYLLLVLGAIALIAQAFYFDFTQDDAFITFRYAANFINGDGLVYNIGERVEGYTNFLWLIILILGKLAGINFIIFSKIAGVGCGIGAILFSFFIAKNIFGNKTVLPGLSCLVLGLVYSLAYWTVSGLEVGAFALAVTASFYFYSKRSLLAVVLVILATLLRPEGGLVFAFILLYDIITAKKITLYGKALFTTYLLALLPYILFKIQYFGGILPNPFYAKTSFDLKQLYNGLEYTGQYFWHYFGAGLFFLPLLLVFKKWTSSIRMIVLFLIVYILYIILIGGDVLKVHRFFVPLMPLMIPVVIYGLVELFKKKYIIFVGVLFLLGWQLYFPRQHVTSFHYSEQMLIKNTDKMITSLLAVDDSDFTLAVSTIGIAGYKLIGHRVIDLLGLTDSTIARHPEEPIHELSTTWKETKFNSKYILSLQPDYILFSTAMKPSAPAERALFLYPQFLGAYRTIGFVFGEFTRDIYKRFHPITGELKRSIDPEFVQMYNQGLNQLSAGRLQESSSSFGKAWKLCPEPKYPYVLYHMAKLELMQNNYPVWDQMINELLKRDTLIYHVYKDLFLIEEYMKGDEDKAEKYRDRLLELVPWLVPKIDSLVVQNQGVIN